MERLIFPYLTYTDPPETLFPRKIPTGFIYTMNATEAAAKERDYDGYIKATGMFMKRIFGSAEALCSYDTCQFEDYSKYVASRFNPEEKLRRRKEIFPKDCQKAYEMGARLAKKAEEMKEVGKATDSDTAKETASELAVSRAKQKWNKQD